MTYKNLTVTLLTLVLMGCGSDGGPAATSTKAEKRGTPTLGSDTTVTADLAIPQSSTWGRVYIDEPLQVTSSASDPKGVFHNQMVALLEPQMNASDVGIVNGLDDRLYETQEDTGVAFWGSGLSLNGGLDPNRTDYQEEEGVFNVDTAELRISIYMAVPNSSDPNILDVQEVPIHFNDKLLGTDSGQLVDSYINGNFVQLTFADEFGKISIAGTFNNELFTGHVFFKTEKIDPDNTGVLTEVDREAQLLGKFEVQTCGFFTCVN